MPGVTIPPKGMKEMPIKIPNELPAYKTLTDENIFVMTETRALTQDIRPVQIAIVNLMPTKIDTETQLLRLLGNTSLQVETELIKMQSHVSKNTSAEHLTAFYKTFSDIRDRNFDRHASSSLSPPEIIPEAEMSGASVHPAPSHFGVSVYHNSAQTTTKQGLPPVSMHEKNSARVCGHCQIHTGT